MRCAAAPWPRRGNKSSLGLWLEGAPWCCAYGSSCARIRHCLAAARYCSSVNQEPEHQTGLLPDGLSPDELFRGVLIQPWPVIKDTPLVRGAAAAMELLSNAGMSHDRPHFGISFVEID